MPFQRTISGTGPASVSLAMSEQVGDDAVHEASLTFSDPCAYSVPPPEALGRAIMHADAYERRVILHQVTWLTYVSACNAVTSNPCMSIERACVRADASRGDMPFDKAALKRAWRIRLSSLLDGTRARDIARDMVRWCAAHQDQISTAPQCYWLERSGEAPIDVSACSDSPMREWPAPVLSVALTLSNLRAAILPDLSLPNADLRGIRAPGAQFDGGHFNGATWAGASLHRAGFAFSNHVNADFERADLREACFRAADLSGARCVKVDLRGALIQHTVLCGTDLSEARCEGLTLTKVRLDGASFDFARLHGACFLGGSAQGMRLVDVRAKRSQWTSVAMRNVQAAGADLRGARFRDCDLAGWDARGAKLNDVHFEACDLRGARFCGASLKRVRIGADCQLAGTQWQDARLRLDDAWLRQLTSSELDKVVQSWMTLPVDQPAQRADVFLQLLRAVSHKPGIIGTWHEAAPPWHRLPVHVQRSDWLGRLLVGGAEAGGVGQALAFAELRAEWLAHALTELTDVCQSNARAAWSIAALMTALHSRCASASQEEVRSLAGAMCQTLYRAGEGAGAMGALRSQALRAAWLGALPAQVHVALSADGIDAADASYIVLIRARGDVAARLPRHLLAGAFDGAVGGCGEHLPASNEGVPGWRWVGTRVIVRDEASPDDFVPGTMLHLQGLVREFGCLSGIWPTERPLDAFVRLVGRWLGQEGVDRANAACHGAWDPLRVAGDMGALSAPDMTLGIVDRRGATMHDARSSGALRLRSAGHADIDEVFRDVPRIVAEDDTPLSDSTSRSVRLVSIAAGLIWLATQPAWQTGDVTLDATPDDARRACRRYALAALNETMTVGTSWRALPQALALQSCLSHDNGSPDELAERLLDWLMCIDIRNLPGLAQACRHTLPWFWAVSLPLRTEIVREAVAPDAHERRITPPTSPKPSDSPEAREMKGEFGRHAARNEGAFA